MDPVRYGHITNGDVYLDELLCVGRFKEFGTPEIEYETVKHSALGGVGVWERAGRQLKEMKGKGNTMFIDADVQGKFHDPTKDIALLIDGYCDVFDGQGLALEKGYRTQFFVTISVFKVGGKPWKFGNDWEGEFEYTASRFVEKNSKIAVPLREIDIPNQINRVKGRDVWPSY